MQFCHLVNVPYMDSLYSSFHLPSLTRWHRTRLLQRAQQVLTTQQQMLTHTGENILHYTLQKKRKHIKLHHYPKGDRIDLSTGGQYFYHCHRENFNSSEHGHFHCFLRQKNIPKRIKPTPLSDWDKNISNAFIHLVAIAMDRFGQPIRLFTVNRWVTDETWYDAQHASYFIKRFHMTLKDDPHWALLDQWVEGMIHLFAPQILWLHHQRDLTMASFVEQHPHDNHYENKAIEELSSIPINLQTQIQWILNGNANAGL